MHSSKKPTLVFGNRGIASITLKVYGPKTSQHSGHYGNFIPNPALRLTKVLSSMKSALPEQRSSVTASTFIM